MKRISIFCLLPLVLVSCSNVKKNLGMERADPDEFAVVNGAPLTMPPNFNLVPPKPGAPPLQQAKTSTTAQGLILGTNIATDGSGETNDAQPSDTLDKTGDASLLSDANNAASQPIKKSTATSSVLKPAAESKRLQQENINTTTSPVMTGQ